MEKPRNSHGLVAPYALFSQDNGNASGDLYRNGTESIPALFEINGMPSVDESTPEISIVIPARNESAGLRLVLPAIADVALSKGTEVIVVDDGSTDETAELARSHGARVVQHPVPMGNGAAVKAGVRAAQGRWLILMDGDGQHDPSDIPALLAMRDRGYRMVVGTRTRGTQASHGRALANAVYNRLAGLVTGQEIRDLTSGFRVVDADVFRSFLHLLPNGFSYPTTITMSFLRSGFPVGFQAIRARARLGNSHIRPVRDGIRFLLIIFRIATLYSPLKIYAPASAMLFVTGLGYYGWTFITAGRFTNMSALLFITSVIVFLIGLVSEQITALMHQRR